MVINHSPELKSALICMTFHISIYINIYYDSPICKKPCPTAGVNLRAFANTFIDIYIVEIVGFIS